MDRLIQARNVRQMAKEHARPGYDARQRVKQDVEMIRYWADRYRNGEVPADAIPPRERDAVCLWLWDHPRDPRGLA